MKISRTVFLEKILRLVLMMVLAFIAAMLGSKAVTGPSCSACPGKGVCNGLADCENYVRK